MWALFVYTTQSSPVPSPGRAPQFGSQLLRVQSPQIHVNLGHLIILLGSYTRATPLTYPGSMVTSGLRLR
jgi:hypothetical protein